MGSADESGLSDSAREWIAEEVRRQMEPMTASIAKVTLQNTAQSETLREFDVWRRGLWGNGSGTLGFLERARREDKEMRREDNERLEERFDAVVVLVGDLRSKILREEGKDEMRREIEENRQKIAKMADDRKTNRLHRWSLWLTIGGSFAGAWFLSLLRPLAREIVGWIMRAIQ